MSSSNVPTEKNAARQFAEYWKGKGYEKGQTQPFWIGMLRVLGVDNPDQGYIEFEDKAHIDSAHGFIDGYIPETHVLVEQKSLGKSLRDGILQSDGSVLNPFQQAKRYAIDLPYSRRPRWVVTCNFAEFLIYDMEKPNAEPESLLLQNLPSELYRLKFLTDTGSETIRREEEISKKAGEVVDLIYDALLKQYRNPENFDSLKSLNELCVRIVFLLYAEDADVFTHLQFHDYLARREACDARRALIDLFKVLDTPPDKRDPYLEADLSAFPYVNGGLFANENLEIPQFTDEILDLILRKGSEDFDWKDISPTIFGAVFESTLNPETRRSGGMHYTSIQNIHKVIDPLFLDRLKAMLAEAKAIADKKARDAALRSFIDHLASLTFLDPACGSGNFLTETYICLRRLENEALAALMGGQTQLDLSGDMVKVSLSQFHGIEINDFAVKVAKTALWIAEHQMLRETASLLHRNLDFLPLKSYDGIVEGNALRMDWSSLLCKCGNVANNQAQSPIETGNIGTGNTSTIPHFSFIIGNPPFVGGKMMDAPQKEGMVSIFGGKWKNLGNMDYVCCWYKKAFDLMAANPSGRAALVEFINRKTRYCFWLKDCSPAFLRASPILRARVEAVRALRLASTAAPTREKADIPHLFFYISHPDAPYLLVPSVSSERRRYIPIGFMDSNTIASNLVQIVPNATLYHFGVLTSNVHMAWLRAVGGRLKSDYRYSNKVVYNNFPWPPGDTGCQPVPRAGSPCSQAISSTAQAILDARAAHPDCSFADLYDDNFMPPDLRRAHQENDRAVMAAYGFSTKMTESECVAALFERYQALLATNPKPETRNFELRTRN